MMKHKRIFAIILSTILLLSVTGCRLAREEAVVATNDDRLIGVFITTEYLDLFDMEKYLDHNIKSISGGDFVIDFNNKMYQGRLYATLAEVALTNEETGEVVQTKEYVFDSAEGIAYFSASVPATEDEKYFTTSGSDAAITDGHVSLHYGDEADKTTLEGTIYLCAQQEITTCYMNPIYQSADGSVYAVSGSGLSSSGSTEGSVFSKTLDESRTITENGNTKTVSTSIKISVAMMLPPVNIVVLQVNADNTVISRAEYSPGELPDTLTPEPGTEYIIVETHKTDSEGNITISRSLHSKSEETIGTFFRREDGVCVKQWIRLNWPDEVGLNYAS